MSASSKVEGLEAKIELLSQQVEELTGKLLKRDAKKVEQTLWHEFFRKQFVLLESLQNKEGEIDKADAICQKVCGYLATKLGFEQVAIFYRKDSEYHPWASHGLRSDEPLNGPLARKFDEISASIPYIFSENGKIHGQAIIPDGSIETPAFFVTHIPCDTRSTVLFAGNFSIHSMRHLKLNISLVEILYATSTQLGLLLNQSIILDKMRDHEKRLSQAKAEADQANRAKNEFLGMIGHELRNSLVPIINVSEFMLKTTVDKAEILESTELIHTGGKKLLDLLENILCYSRLSNSDLIINEVSFCPYEHAVVLVDSLESMTRGNTLAIDLKHKDLLKLPENLIVDGDMLKIEQIITNLLTNAFKFTKNGQVTLRMGIESIYHNKVMIRYEVEDNGIGMSADFLAKVFTPYTQGEQLDTTKSVGIGLGLSICKKMANGMNGNITVESEVSKGSLFKVTIPVTYEPNIYSLDS